MMKAAIAFAASLPGVQYVDLTVSEGSVGATALYERLGFRVWGIEPAAMRIDCVDVAEPHMVLDLGSPSLK